MIPNAVVVHTAKKSRMLKMRIIMVTIKAMYAGLTLIGFAMIFSG